MSEVDDHQGHDLLSDLPLSIIHIILALVPIRDAVKTSVLSTQWRYTWTTLPQLVFDNECANKDCREGHKYEEIISRVIFLHKGPIHSSEYCEIQRTKLKIKISAPNLKYISLLGTDEIIGINAPLVTEIFINYQYISAPDQDELKRSALDYAKCLAGFTNLQKLRGIGYFTKLMIFGIELCHHTLAFRHLKLIDIDVNFENVKEIMVLARLVIGAPSLQLLIIRSWKERYGSDPDLSLDDFSFAPNFKVENLTDVSLVNSDVCPLEVEFLKILFEKSPALESVRVDTEDNQNKVRAILQGCNRASPPIVKPCCEKTMAYRFQQPL